MRTYRAPGEGVYSLARGEDLTRGRVVAATGTIDVNGTVGPWAASRRRSSAAGRHDLPGALEGGGRRPQGRQPRPRRAVDTFDQARTALRQSP
ncbi:MAG TPA: hypothetical protein VKL22_00815 [Actinomycetota bacterium]|nr:hypothetical protein [Actinomycetota bacterium]